MTRLTTLALLTGLLTGPAFASDKEAIQALDDTFSAAVNRGDTAAVIALYAPDAVILPPGSDPVPQSAAKAMFDGMVKTVGHFQLTAHQVDRLSPDYIREIGTYTLQNRASPPQSQTATYVVVWKRVDGQWKLWTDIFH